MTVIAKGVPPGWGEPVFERLDADLASAMMGINAVKGVEIGAGFSAVEQRGSEHRDEITPQGFKSNHAGGVLGGISSGQDIVVSLALEANLQHHAAGRDHRHSRRTGRGRHHRAPRSLRRHSRHADCRGDAGAGA